MNNKASTAEDILASARALIVSGGHDGFSHADIADVVGICGVIMDAHPTRRAATG